MPPVHHPAPHLRGERIITANGKLIGAGYAKFCDLDPRERLFKVKKRVDDEMEGLEEGWTSAWFRWWEVGES